MACNDCRDENVVTNSEPYKKDIILSPDSDLRIKIQGIKDDDPKDWTNGDLELNVYDLERTLIFNKEDNDFIRSQTDGTNDTVTLVVKRSEELTNLIKEEPYPFTITFTDNEATITIWYANLILL